MESDVLFAFQIPVSPKHLDRLSLNLVRESISGFSFQNVNLSCFFCKETPGKNRMICLLEKISSTP